MEKMEQKWYDKTWLVIVLLIIFFPLGLYTLWMNKNIKKGWKIAVSIIYGLIILSNFSNIKKTNQLDISDNFNKKRYCN